MHSDSGDTERLDKGSPAYVWIAIFPVVLFCFLDAYYLGLERLFRRTYNTFIRKLDPMPSGADNRPAPPPSLALQSAAA